MLSWESYLAIGLMVLLLLAGGYIRKLIKEISEFFNVLKSAIEDGEITPEETVSIIKEAKDIKSAVVEIIKAVNK